MPLFDVTTRDYYVNPKKAATSKHIQKVMIVFPTVTFDKILRILDEAIDSVKPSKASQLVWTKTGALFGRKSPRPLRDVEYVWEKVIAAVGNSKHCLIAMGALFRWRISLRPEMWLAYREESASIDESTGRHIHVSKYWIDENYNGEVPKTQAQLDSPALANDISLLANKFNHKVS